MNREENDVQPSTPNDPSTGPARGAGAVAPTALGRQARRFLLASVALLVAACSQLQLGYNNADTVVAYALDSYLDLDDGQERLARGSIGALHCWHRRTQLPGYAQLLGDAQRKVAGPVTAADVLAFNAGMRRALSAIGEHAAPDLAALALTLKPAQLDRLADKLARDTSKARRELVRFAGAESVEQRVDRYAERAEEWFGRLTPAQRELIRDSLQRRPQAEEAWMRERERRQQELVAVMARIRAEQPPPSTATAWLREYFAELAQPGDAQRRADLEAYREENAELVARLVNSATPSQRATLAKKLRGYAADFDALAAKAAVDGCG
jgi:DNA-binding MarR family transcriptional regulator